MLTAEHKVTIRFSEVDSMGVVWHGNYVQFLEDARETFGTLHGMGYMDVYRNGYFIPVVNMNIDYKQRAEYEDNLIVKIELKDTFAAKMIFNYVVMNADTEQILATATTTQVFTNAKTGELNLNIPDFYVEWKKERGLKH